MPETVILWVKIKPKVPFSSIYEKKKSIQFKNIIYITHNIAQKDKLCFYDNFYMSFVLQSVSQSQPLSTKHAP